MPHEKLLEMIADLKRLLEKERNMVVKDGWSNMCKQRAEQNVDNAIIELQDIVSQ